MTKNKSAMLQLECTSTIHLVSVSLPLRTSLKSLVLRYIRIFLPKMRFSVLSGCFEQYLKQTDELEDYQDFTLEEKLSHMVYTHFELFQREKEFVEDTFKDLIAKASAKSKFQQMLEDRIDLLLSQSHGDASLLQGPYLSQFIVKELLSVSFLAAG